MTVPQLQSDHKSVVTSALDMDSQSVIYSDANPLVIRSEATAMKVARMISRTMLGMAAIIGVFIFMSAYLQSRPCNCIQGSESSSNPYYEPLAALSSDDTAKNLKRLPIRIHMDAGAGDLMRNKNKGHMSCAVERKTATQIIASEPKLIMTQFGNITTDPRLIQIKGEKMVFTCSTKDKMLPTKKKSYRKFGTVMRLNRVEDEKTVSKPEKPMENEAKDRPKRSLEAVTKKECACDCTC